MNKEEVIKAFLVCHSHSDSDPCIKWFDETYCKNCKTVIENGREYAYCELNDKCRYFKDADEMPDNSQIIKLWLESQVKNIV